MTMEEVMQPSPVLPPDPTLSGQLVVPPAPQKQSNLFLWLAVILGIAIAGGSFYFWYSGRQQVSVEKVPPPPFTNISCKPQDGFNASNPAGPTGALTTPSALTASDSVSDIGQDLSGTAIESANASEFTADLESL